MNIRHSDTPAPKILPLPAFSDNYIWTLRVGKDVAVVDPGDAAVVEDYINRHDLRLTAILITHHHADHTGGVLALTARGDVRVFGPAKAEIPGVSDPVSEGDRVQLDEFGINFDVLEVPGHTQTHIAYLAPGILFPGDTLFSAGCGRLLGGTAEQLHTSLQRLASLPADTRVYCTHEYTLANLRFARAAEPRNPERDAWQQHCERERAAGRPTLPSSIAREKRINPFLRTDCDEVLDAVARHSGHRPEDAQACFAELRRWKDGF